MDTLGREHEINVGGLFKKINAKNKPVKSYSLSLCKFLGFVESEGVKVKLTKLGFKYINTSQRKELAAHNLPDKYLTILGWVKTNNGTMSLDEIKTAIIDNWGTPPKERAFSSMLRIFANYCSYIGVLKYVKGAAGRIELTQLGYNSLSKSKTQINEEPLEKLESSVEEEDTIPIDKNSNFPITITAKGAPIFKWDIKTEADLQVIEAVWNSIKERWKKENDDVETE